MGRRKKDVSVNESTRNKYLWEHLDEVKELITKWVPQLVALPPFDYQQQEWGWDSPYVPALERDPDSNHILRRHLRSRALWSHHWNWERHLNRIWTLSQAVREETAISYRGLKRKKQRTHHEDFVNTALWKGFQKACEVRVDHMYRPSDDGIGVFYGAYRIDDYAESAEERMLIEREHWGLIESTAKLEKMVEIADIWKEVQRLQDQMKLIAGEALMSNDIFHHCRFCKHLWN